MRKIDIVYEINAMRHARAWVDGNDMHVWGTRYRAMCSESDANDIRIAINLINITYNKRVFFVP